MAGAAQGHLSPGSHAPCSQWPYCEKRCSYCNFNKYIPRGVDEAALRRCLVTEAQTLLRLSGVRRWVLRAGSWNYVGQQNRLQASRRAPPHFHLHSLSLEWSLCSSVGVPPVWPAPRLWQPSWRQWPRQLTCLQTLKSHWKPTPLRPQAPGWQHLGQQESTGCPLASR